MHLMPFLHCNVVQISHHACSIFLYHATSMEGLLSRIRLDLIERELQGAIKLEEDSDRSLSQKVERRCNTQEIVLQLSEVSVEHVFIPFLCSKRSKSFREMSRRNSIATTGQTTKSPHGVGTKRSNRPSPKDLVTFRRLGGVDLASA